MAALRRSIITYKELGFAIGLKDIELRDEMRHVLEQLDNECHKDGEPPMSSEPFTSGPPCPDRWFLGCPAWSVSPGCRPSPSAAYARSG